MLWVNDKLLYASILCRDYHKFGGDNMNSCSRTVREWDDIQPDLCKKLNQADQNIKGSVAKYKTNDDFRRNLKICD